MILSCPTCLRRVRREGATEEVLQVGGSRRASGDPVLAAWDVWFRSQTGRLGPVAGTCSSCGLPWVAEVGTPDPGATWRFPTPAGVVEADTSGLRGPNGSLTLEEADGFIRRQLTTSRWADYADPRALFLMGPMVILAVMAIGWLVAATYVVQFILAAGLQHDLSLPMQR